MTNGDIALVAPRVRAEGGAVSVALVYEGVPIRRWCHAIDMLNATDMWKANGSDPNRQPAEWLRSADAKRFIEVNFAAGILGDSQDEVIQTLRGGTPTTWVHWQVGLAYAGYLNPIFRSHIQAVWRGWAEGTLPVAPTAPQGITAADLMQAAVVFGREVRGVVHDEVSSALVPISGSIATLQEDTASLKVGFVAVQEGFLALSGDVAAGLSEIYRMADRGRKAFPKATRTGAILAAHAQGGLCPCCKRNRITNSDGTRAPHVEFHHKDSARHDNSPDNCTPLCRECHAEFTAAPLAAEAKYEKRIAAFHEARREQFGQSKLPECRHQPRHGKLADSRQSSIF